MASAFRILGEGQLSLTKFLLVTDHEVDLRDIRATLSHILARTRPETDLYVVSNLSMDTLDYTGPEVNLGSKGVLLGMGDPVRDLPGEFTTSAVPPDINRVRVFCPGCLVVDGPDYAAEPEAASGWLATRPLPTGRSSSSPMTPTARPRARSTFSGPPLPVSSPPRTSTPPRSGWCGTTSPTRRPWSSTRG